ncbi:PAS domain-containing hybrid sensor histidine kinase/response regulator [Lewinella sp. IMCC34183]|uniref:PAS domain-containing hybrid sensor histidine kinase/response regulator n=1 Tax=Lewinella sp. IMCC34183 TaxID=2248762 RepID=UPI000E222F42|nr:PAS domain-containing hybrid sensor histidine kinase/response regulator [Lewinella sp. IMCC34183]
MEDNYYLKKELYELIKTDESIFDFIQESSLDGMWYWDLEKPDEEWMSPKFWSVLGYDHTEMPHTPSAWQHIVHPEDLKLATENFVKHCENPDYPYSQMVRYTHKDGSIVWIRCRGVVIRNKDGKPIRMLGAHQDVTSLKKGELLFTKNSSLLQSTQKIAKIGSWELDLKSNEVLWTEELYKMYGFDPTLPPPPVDEHMKLFTPESWEALEAALALASEQGIPYEMELRTRRGNGDNGWMWVRGEAVFDENKNIVGLRGVAQDITCKKREELEKEELSKRLNYALDASGDGIWDWTPATGKTVFSKAWVEMLGYEVGELPSLASEWVDRLHPDDKDWVSAEITKVTQSDKNGDTFGFEYRFRNKEGDYLWILNKGKVVERNDVGEAARVVGTHTNITARKRAEQAQKESELRLSLATQAGGVGVWDWDIVTNSMIWDDQMYSLYGVEREAFPDAYQIWTNGFHGPDGEQINREIELAVTGEKEFNTEFRIERPNGQIRNIRALATVVRDRQGNAIRMIGTNWDITKEKEVLKQIEDSKEQVEKASKAKSEFLANMSHEIRTPLNSVIGFTDLLKKTSLSSVQQQYVNNANVSGHALLSIINDILDLSKIEAGMLELEIIKTDMIELLSNSFDIMKFSAAEKGLELLLDVDPTMPRFANVDPIRLKQLLINLLGNAVKFSREGEVELKVRYQALDNQQGKLSIAVRDTGIGISDEQKDKLFKPFSQGDSSTTRKFGGTGLGLVISEMIANKMGSKIGIDSTVDVGTTFYFDMVTRFEEGRKLDTTQIAGVERCLIIDDNASNRLILEQMLNEWQITSDCCENGLEALKQLETSEPYDVIICDYNMPYINGVETISMIKDKLKVDTERQPIILLHSSLDNLQLSQQCDELGVRFRLNKPVKSDDLFSYLCNLPQVAAATPRKETEPRVKEEGTTQKAKFIIAEDEPFNMLLSKTVLSQLVPDCEIYEAKNGVEAIEQYGNTLPDLIFMDIHMPELDGIEATRQIREIEVRTGNKVTIVALTAGVLKEEKDKCLAAGMDEFLTKPLKLEKIEAVLGKYFHNAVGSPAG